MFVKVEQFEEFMHQVILKNFLFENLLRKQIQGMQGVRMCYSEYGHENYPERAWMAACLYKQVSHFSKISKETQFENQFVSIKNKQKSSKFIQKSEFDKLKMDPPEDCVLDKYREGMSSENSKEG